MQHELKTWPLYFNAVWRGEKTFEVRENDRDFSIDDDLLLREWDPHLQDYTGRTIDAMVTYICRLPNPIRDYVGMQIEVLAIHRR